MDREPPAQEDTARPASAVVEITIHPALPPAGAIAMFVSPADQAFIDAALTRSHALAFARGHVRR